MHVGVDSFVSAVTDPRTGSEVGAQERLEHLLEEIVTAEQSGLYSSVSASTTARSTTTRRRPSSSVRPPL